MKQLFYLLILIVGFCSCKPSFNDLSQDQKVNLLVSLDSLELIDLFFKVDSINSERYSINDATSNLDSLKISFPRGGAIPYNLAEIYTKEYRNYGGFWLRNRSSMEKSVYFSKIEIDKMFNQINLPSKDSLGVRIYFARYDDSNIVPDSLKNKMTVILRLCDNEKDIEFSKNNSYDAAYNFGDLCPKVCGRHVNQETGDFPTEEGK